MKIVISGESVATGKWVEIIVPCEQSVYTCSINKDEISLTTYLEENGIEVRTYERGCSIPRVVVNTDELYYHICLWDFTDADLMDVTIDFKLRYAKWTVFADDYDVAKIRCSD